MDDIKGYNIILLFWMKVGLFIGLLLAAISIFTIKELASNQFADF